MCDTRTNTIVSICRKGADAEHELGTLLKEMARGYFLNPTKIREAVVARGGTEALQFLERELLRQDREGHQRGLLTKEARRVLAGDPGAGKVLQNALGELSDPARPFLPALHFEREYPPLDGAREGVEG